MLQRVKEKERRNWRLVRAEEIQDNENTKEEVTRLEGEDKNKEERSQEKENVRNESEKTEERNKESEDKKDAGEPEGRKLTDLKFRLGRAAPGD